MREVREIKEEFENIQLNLECPITHEIMKDPVILIETGISYDRKAIEAWLEKHDTDPITRKQLNDKTLVTNYALKSLCDQTTKFKQGLDI